MPSSFQYFKSAYLSSTFLFVDTYIQLSFILNMRVLLIALLAAISYAQTVLEAWEHFVRKYSKIYSAEEHPRRFRIFQEKYERIQAVNRENNTWIAGVNQFADLTHQEFLEKVTCSSVKLGISDSTTFHKIDGNILPTAVDWRNEGAVTVVKNQGQCGSCWAFATTGALESIWKIQGGKLPILSEQEFVSCSPGTCYAGFIPYLAMKWAQNQTICSEDSIPYTAGEMRPPPNVCNMQNCTSVIPKGAVTGYTFVKPHSENDLLHAVAQQPVAVSLDPSEFQNYRGGILTKACQEYHEWHAVLVVGYGTDLKLGLDYWLLKNSWGPEFGENGYIRIARSDPYCSRYPGGECDIYSQPVYPSVQV